MRCTLRVVALAAVLFALGAVGAQAQADGGAAVCAPPPGGANMLFLADAATARRPPAERCFCGTSANCWDGSTVSCSDSSSPCSCYSEDQNCLTGTLGHATCNGQTFGCPACPDPQCPNVSCLQVSCNSHSDCCGQTGNGWCYQGTCLCP